MSPEILPAASARQTGDRAPEVIYETDRTRVVQLTAPDGVTTLIRKEQLGPGGLDRTRHELRILRRLAGVPGVVQLADPAADAIVMADVPGPSVAQVISWGGFDSPSCLAFAEELARIVADIHRLGVMHCDISPANIFLTGQAADGSGGSTDFTDGSVLHPTLIDFHLASTFVDQVPSFSHPRNIVGTPPYLAPEQTGRTGISVDHRADLYGVGTTLYALSTGEPPFRQADLLTTIHDILTEVPTPPTDLNPRVPRQFSDIVMRLLEKEPDRRYQSAEGLVHDLSRLRADLAAGRVDGFALGERDFPRRLAVPSRLIGRDAEIAQLRSALDAARLGGGRTVLITGPPGVGKSALINMLRPVVTECGGWLVAGKFDQYRQDAREGAVSQALRSLGRLLLAGDEDELAHIRGRLADAVGEDLGQLSALPEFATLGGVDPAGGAAPAPGDPREAEARQQQLLLAVLQSVVSAQRPVVIAIDDLQWAGAASIAVIDAIATAEHLNGVLLIGAYRDGEIDEAHPLSVAQARWERLGVAPTTMRLANLRPDDLSALLGEMLRLPAAEARELAAAVGSTTDGNPFDTVELVNALRHEGALVQGTAGWQWDATTIRRFVGRGDVLDLLAARIERLPAATQELLEIMSCVGNEVSLDLLSTAADRTPDDTDEQLVAALEDGLLLRTLDESPLVRFRHDRVQQAVRVRLGGAEMHLSIARRLSGHPEFGAIAAEQYLQCTAALGDADEIRTAAELFVEAAATVRLVNPAAADRFLTTAIAMLGSTGTTAAEVDPLLVAAWRHHHAVLSVLGRLAEADEVYAAIERLDLDPVDVVAPACVQIAGLTGRARPQEAIALGLVLLAKLGVRPADNDFAGDVARGYPDLIRWATESTAAVDLARPESDSPVIKAASCLIHSMITPSHFIDPAIADWLIITAHRLWIRHGPNAPLAATLCTAVGTLGMRGDFDAGYAAAVHVRTIGEARGYEPETSYIRHILSIGSQHYYEPLEDCVRQAHRSREGLIRGGDLHTACWTYFSAPAALLDCAPTMDAFAADVDAGLLFAARTGSEHGTATCLPFRQLARALRGETDGPGSFDDATFTEAEHLASVSANPLATAYFHAYRSLSAALFGDVPALIRHTAPATALFKLFVGLYPTVLVHLLHGLALAERIRAAAPAERAALLEELDQARDWLAARAAGRPDNFGHLVTLLDAERAGAIGDRWGAAERFDAARHQVRTRNRPWHQALITERAARFHLGQDMAQAGRDLLAETRRHYVAWSATGKVAQLDLDHPFLRPTAIGSTIGSISTTMSGMGGNMSGQALDLLAVLRSSQALSSETTPEGLRTRVGEVLRAMTGATTVLIVLRDDDTGDWQLWDTTGGTADGVPLADAAALLPLSAFRYAERSGQPLLVGDPHTDERFAHDPHLAGVPRCSLLAMPLFRKGVLRGVLILENTRRTGAFAADGLEAVLLVAGQLTVSLDNTQLYASLERKVLDRTAALERANSTLAALSTTDALTEMPNRRHFDDMLRTEWHRATAQQTALGLAMIDVDAFKRYNDHYGHLAGDECLRRVAKTLGATLRDGADMACRYGGEEFAIILPGADEAGCMLVAERIRAAVQDLDLLHDASPIGRVTISVGVASYRPQLDEVDAADHLIALADQALYAAKHGGRNRVCASLAG